MEDPLLLKTLTEEIKSIKATLDEAKATGQSLNEAQTEFIIVDPILESLGYGPLEISKQGHDSVAKNFPDYTLLAGKPEKWFLEAKKLDLKLQDSEAMQAVGYAFNQGAEWAVLTNGRSWYIYNAHIKKPLSEKRVMQIDDLFAEGNAVEILQLLSKPSILNNDLKEAWLFQQLTRLVARQLNTPNSDLRAIIRKLGGEATNVTLTDEIVGKVLMFAMPVTIVPSKQSEKDNSQDNTGPGQTTKLEPQKPSNDWHTFDEIAKDVGLATYRKPTDLMLGTVTETVKTWADVAQFVVKHIGNAYILPPLPYNAGTKGKNYFLNSSATHTDGKKMQSHRIVQIDSETVYIDTNRSTLNICASILALLNLLMFL